MPPTRPRKLARPSPFKKSLQGLLRSFIGGKGRAMPKRTSRGPTLKPIMMKAKKPTITPTITKRLKRGK